HAFLYSGGVMNDLGTLGGWGSYAYGINNQGQVVGTAQTAAGSWHAFLYSGGVMTDLNSQLPANSGWTALTRANSINDAGQIIGSGINSAGFTHGFVLNPNA
ncbi:MAG TPA: hypothetical protein VKU02_30735, partial [Gemmataceae bacterium]|nr:hypothetical protein [Gemmataceae bacterium]